MNRRQFTQYSALFLIAGNVPLMAHALSLNELSNKDATAGLKLALDKGASAAVALLGAQDGFLGNDRVRIPLPGYLNDAAGLLRTLGQGRQVDELLTAMNRGAEAAVPKAKALLTRAVQAMTVDDAKGILAGGQTAVTDFFASKTRSGLGVEFLPIVTQATSKLGLAEKYNQVAGRGAELGLVKKEDANIQQYVTTKALDGLYWMIGEEEKKIRQNPVGYGSALLTKVFGAL
ncbi:DUF4197 domain-containing protein [Curvibacter sp. APW13]|uniref:DUF4197 domain-containing protein n=1 Tax=Curvibacter sp. APW13 TaxID=3077236 RepID=UPI0028DFFD0A|nr:DUF4197 domain-containing protein [Curvibacter sp. APW13]MDT8990626.1 DUF4197 domain-containing protein [Curvibacter sp. APW13]